MLLNYHIGRFVLVSLCVGNLVRLGLSSIRVAGFSLQHGESLFVAVEIGAFPGVGLNASPAKCSRDS